MARGGHCLPGDAVNLVEGVGPQEPVVSCANEQLQGQRLTLHITVQLSGGERKEAIVVKPSCFLQRKNHPLASCQKQTKVFQRSGPQCMVFKQSTHLGSCDHHFIFSNLLPMAFVHFLHVSPSEMLILQ